MILNYEHCGDPKAFDWLTGEGASHKEPLIEGL